MKADLQPKERIGVNEKWEWSLDGIALESRKRLQLRIGGHWILGALIKTKDSQLFWSSWIDNVSIPVTFFMRARWPKEV